MMNSLGIIQNNGGTTDFMKFLKTNKRQYKLLKKEEERKLVDEWVEPMKYADGSDVLDPTDKMYVKWAMETDEAKRRNLYYRVRRVLVWKKPQKEFCDMLVMHNIRFVFSLAKKFCKDTRDFDNMVEKGLYGLVKAANLFNPFSPTTKPNPGDKENKIVQFDSKGNIIPIKFCTYAKNWIFKYIVEEFQDKTVTVIDNNSTSINELVKIRNSTNGKHTVENYIDEMISPDYSKPKTITEELSDLETRDFYDGISKYLYTTNELTALEKKIIIDTYFNGRKSKDIALETHNSSQVIAMNKVKALKKLKRFMKEKYSVTSMNDI